MRRVLFGCLTVFVCNVGAQSGSMSGRVFDPAHAVIGGAKVTVGDAIAVTNAEGWYSIDKLGPNDYRLTISAPGFADYTRLVRVPSRNLQRDVTLAIAPFGERILVT